jgi:hypothetical protein
MTSHTHAAIGLLMDWTGDISKSEALTTLKCCRQNPCSTKCRTARLMRSRWRTNFGLRQCLADRFASDIDRRNPPRFLRGVAPITTMLSSRIDTNKEVQSNRGSTVLKIRKLWAQQLHASAIGQHWAWSALAEFQVWERRPSGNDDIAASSMCLASCRRWSSSNVSARSIAIFNSHA